MALTINLIPLFDQHVKGRNWKKAAYAESKLAMRVDVHGWRGHKINKVKLRKNVTGSKEVVLER